MANNLTSIELDWDTKGNIRHKLAGPILPGPDDNEDLWILAPSAPMFLVESLAKTKPTRGLKLCATIIDIVFHDKKYASPINETLKHGRLDYVYQPDKSANLIFFPRHNLSYNKEDLEQGIDQLICNYYYYVYHRLSKYHGIVLKTFTGSTMTSYFDFLSKMALQGEIGPGRDRYNDKFSLYSLSANQMISLKYYKPVEGDTDWAEKQTNFLIDTKIPQVEKMYKAISKIMQIA